MIWIFIVSLVFAIACLVAAGVNDEWEGFFYGLWFAECVLIAALLAINMWREPSEPSSNAIDVYRGRITLEITYRDSLAVDSVVVFKEGFKEE